MVSKPLPVVSSQQRQRQLPEMRNNTQTKKMIMRKGEHRRRSEIHHSIHLHRNKHSPHTYKIYTASCRFFASAAAAAASWNQTNKKRKAHWTCPFKCDSLTFT